MKDMNNHAPVNELEAIWTYTDDDWEFPSALLRDDEGLLYLQTGHRTEPVSWRKALEWLAHVDRFSENATGSIGDVAEALLDLINAGEAPPVTDSWEPVQPEPFK